MNIYIDMDGVLVDLLGRIEHDAGLKHANNRGYALEPEIWDFINAQDWAWWGDLPVYPWYHDLLDMMPTKPTLLTHACNKEAFDGKKIWAVEHGFEIIFTDKKHLVGNGLLIDDCVAQIDRWQGPSILFPQPWNKAGARMKKPIDQITYVRNELFKIESQRAPYLLQAILSIYETD